MKRGERFSKLDFSQAHQQLVLDKGSRKYLTGLFQPTRSQYSIHSAAGIFQKKKMEKSLSHVPFTVLRMYNIVISEKNGSKHFQNLDSVLDVVKKCGL